MGGNRGPKPRPPWSKLAIPTNPLAGAVGETLERIHVVPSDVSNLKASYKSITLCFSNGKAVHFDAEMHMCIDGVIPVVRLCTGDWEMLKAEGLPSSVDEANQNYYNSDT